MNTCPFTSSSLLGLSVPIPTRCLKTAAVCVSVFSLTWTTKPFNVVVAPSLLLISSCDKSIFIPVATPGTAPVLPKKSVASSSDEKTTSRPLIKLFRLVAATASLVKFVLRDEKTISLPGVFCSLT